MSDVFDKAFKEPTAEGQQGEAKTQEQTTPVEAPVEGDGAPPAPQENTEKHVPLAAYEAERAKRQDWKEKAIRAEERARLLEEQAAGRNQPPQEQPQMDPAELHAARTESLFLDQSEKLAVKEHGKEIVDKAFEWFDAERQKNPALHKQVLAGRDPYGDMVAMHQRHAALAEIGEDPAAYKARIRAEIEAELKGSTGTTPPVKAPAAPLPKSLADARSSAVRTATWSGPTPLNAIL